MDRTLSFLLKRNSFHKILLTGTVVAIKNVFFVCCFLRMINWCRLVDL